jgi:hypothetical protein
MARSAPIPPHVRPTRIVHDGRDWPMYYEPAGWRLRSKAKGRLADFRTGTRNLKEATRRAKEYLDRRTNDPRHSRKGGGTLEALAVVYIETPKRTKANVAENNVSRLRGICRTIGRELATVTCREIGPEFWQAYQRRALEAAGRRFDLVTRYRENVRINAAVRAARCLFLRALLPAYRAAGLDVRPDAGEAVMMPVPYLPPTVVDDAAVVDAWSTLEDSDRLWLVIGLARFAGLRREEISALRGGWIEEQDGVVSISLRDRPEESWWTKTGKPYRAQVIEPRLAEWLRTAAQKRKTLVVPDPPDGSDRGRWFANAPQRWLRAAGVHDPRKPLHRLRGLYADHVARLTADAVAARLAGIEAARANLGHTTAAVTEAHYLTPAR